MPREKGLEELIQLARLASEARGGERILPLLASALVEQVGAAAVAGEGTTFTLAFPAQVSGG